MTLFSKTVFKSPIKPYPSPLQTLPKVPEKGIQVECESTLFAPGFELKKISALVSPNGQTSVAPVQIFYCINCGSRYNLEDLK